MSSFSLQYWSGKGGVNDRIYVNGDFVDDLKIYFMFDGTDDPPRVFGSEDRSRYPSPYDGSDIPAQAVARQALIDHDIDPENYSWGELWEACR